MSDLCLPGATVWTGAPSAADSGYDFAWILRNCDGSTVCLSEDESDPEILRLRALREAMDQAVLAAYRWPELSPTDTAEIVTRLRALNAERAAEEKRKT